MVSCGASASRLNVDLNIVTWRQAFGTDEGRDVEVEGVGKIEPPRPDAR